MVELMVLLSIWLYLFVYGALCKAGPCCFAERETKTQQGNLTACSAKQTPKWDQPIFSIPKPVFSMCLLLRAVHGDVPASLLPRLCTPCGKKLMRTVGGVSLALYLSVSSHPWDIHLKRACLSQLCSQTMSVWAIQSTGL